MKGTVVVTGIPGTGKSTVCNLVLKFAGEAGVKVNLLNYGTITLEILQETWRCDREGRYAEI